MELNPFSCSHQALHITDYHFLAASNSVSASFIHQLPCGFTGISSSNCQEMETSMARTYQTPQQPFQNHPSGHLGRQAMPWSGKEMLDGHHQRVDIPAHARTAHKGLLQKRLEKALC